VVLFLTEAQEQRATPPARAVELTVAKNRHGDTGKVGLLFLPDLGTMQPEQTTGTPRCARGGQRQDIVV
jgi:replicative DNA helicase